MVVGVVSESGEFPVFGLHLFLLEDDLSGIGGGGGDEVYIEIFG